MGIWRKSISGWGRSQCHGLKVGLCSASLWNPMIASVGVALAPRKVTGGILHTARTSFGPHWALCISLLVRWKDITSSYSGCSSGESVEEELARVEVERPLGTFPVTETPFPTVAHLKNTCSNFQPRFKDLLSSTSFSKSLLFPLQNWPIPQQSPLPLMNTCPPTFLIGSRYFAFTTL